MKKYPRELKLFLIADEAQPEIAESTLIATFALKPSKNFPSLWELPAPQQVTFPTGETISVCVEIDRFGSVFSAYSGKNRLCTHQGEKPFSTKFSLPSGRTVWAQLVDGRADAIARVRLFWATHERRIERMLMWFFPIGFWCAMVLSGALDEALGTHIREMLLAGNESRYWHNQNAFSSSLLIMGLYSAIGIFKKNLGLPLRITCLLSALAGVARFAQIMLYDACVGYEGWLCTTFFR